MRGSPVEDGHLPTVPNRHVGREDVVVQQRAHLNTIGDFGLLEDSQVEVVLIHIPQIRLKSPIPPVPYDIHTETDNGLPVLSRPPDATPCMSPLRNSYSQLTAGSFPLAAPRLHAGPSCIHCTRLVSYLPYHRLTSPSAVLFLYPPPCSDPTNVTSRLCSACVPGK